MNLKGILLTVALALLLLCACTKGEMGYSYTDSSEQGKVLILYASASNNGLSGYIANNIKFISEGMLPGGSSRKAVLIYAHMDGEESYLQRISSDEYGAPVSDTLLTITTGRSASDPEVLTEVLEKVGEEYPSEENSYLLILSSHGSGWFPSGVSNQDGQDITWSYIPRKRTYGTERVNGTTYEMSVQELAEAIPMKLDCLVFDACLMGGIEVAYELRDKVVKLCCSPAEVPGAGYDYSAIGADLLSDDATPETFSRAFYELYENNATYGATSTTVDCTKLQPLAEICKELFEKYREKIAFVDATAVQPFHRTDPRQTYYRDFYDLRDILVHAGISTEEDATLQGALAACITYKASTPWFMRYDYGFEINAYCGLSMYLPCAGNATLNAFYKTLAWNKATGLIE